MSKGKIDVVFNVTSYGSDPKVLMRAMLRKEGSNAKGASIAGTLVLKPRHEIKKFETFQLIAANYKKLDELDQAANEAKGNIKLVIENVPAEFIHSTRQSDGSEYDAVLVNLGTEKAPHMRVFYLSDMQSELLQKGFKPKYKFDVQENMVDKKNKIFNNRILRWKFKKNILIVLRIVLQIIRYICKYIPFK